MKSIKSIQKEISWLIRDKYHGDKSATGVERDIKRLQTGEPVDYVIGWKEFLGCKIELSKKPLIPREETEYWVSQVIERFTHESRINSKIRVLDLFAGSGCIGLAILKHWPESTVYFGEVDSKLCEQIKLNCKQNGIKASQYKVVKTDVFKDIKAKFDYIFANPPYIPRNAPTKTQQSVINWEPAKALWGGNDGLYYVGKILKDLRNHLTPSGILYLEFDHRTRRELENLLKSYDLAYVMHKDQFDRYRWTEVTFEKSP